MPYLRFDIWDWRAIIVGFEIRLFSLQPGDLAFGLEKGRMPPKFLDVIFEEFWSIRLRVSSI